MNAYFIASAVLLFAIALAHSVLGEMFLIGPLYKIKFVKLFGSETFAKRTLRFAWHLTTIAWWAIAALIFIWASMETTPSIEMFARILVVAFIATSAVSLIIARGKHWISWVGFLVIAALTGLGTTQTASW